jgi:chemotaxis protein methyltransferase CheR
VKCEVVQTKAGLAYRHFRGIAHRSIRPREAPPAPPAAVRPVPATLEPIQLPPVLPPPSLGPNGALNPSQSLPVDTAADCYVQRDYERTISLLASAAARGDASAAESVLYIRSLANLGRLDEAGRACATALDRYRDNAELHYLHAVLVAQSGQFVESARAAKRALYLDRSMIVAHLALGSALASSGDTAGAHRAFAAAERLLGAMSADAPVPGTDGEPAGRLQEMTRVQAKLLTAGDAA